MPDSPTVGRCECGAMADLVRGLCARCRVNAENRALRNEAFRNYYAGLAPKCSMCDQPQTVLAPAGGMDAYTFCETCDRGGGATINDLGGMEEAGGNSGCDHIWSAWLPGGFGGETRHCIKCEKREWAN